MLRHASSRSHKGLFDYSWVAVASQGIEIHQDVPPGAATRERGAKIAMARERHRKWTAGLNGKTFKKINNTHAQFVGKVDFRARNA
jgi:hypothetical protein